MKIIFMIGLFLGASSLFAGWSEIELNGSKVFIHTPEKTSQFKGKMPLMIGLHGCAQKAQVMKEHGNWAKASNAHQTIIAVPEVPNGGVIAGCWDYYGLDHNRGNRHNKFIFQLVETLKKQFSVDSSKVFISGLSSGAGASMVYGCMAPDVFSGVGLNAGPSVGTQSGDIGRASISVDQVKKNCMKLAGLKKSHFKKQKISIIFGDNDYLVDPNYNRINAKAFASIYSAKASRNFDLDQFTGNNTKGEGTLYTNSGKARVSLIQNTGLGHNWPAGEGSGFASYISFNSLNYPDYLLSFLLK